MQVEDVKRRRGRYRPSRLSIVTFPATSSHPSSPAPSIRCIDAVDSQDVNLKMGNASQSIEQDRNVRPKVEDPDDSGFSDTLSGPLPSITPDAPDWAPSPYTLTNSAASQPVPIPVGTRPPLTPSSPVSDLYTTMFLPPSSSSTDTIPTIQIEDFLTALTSHPSLPTSISTSPRSCITSLENGSHGFSAHRLPRESSKSKPDRNNSSNLHSPTASSSSPSRGI
jgi:hypothetical protein